MALLSGSQSCGGARADGRRSSSSSLSPPDARAFTAPLALPSSLLLVPVTTTLQTRQGRKLLHLLSAYPSSHTGLFHRGIPFTVSLAAMSEHLPLRSSVGSRDSAPLSHHHQQQQHQYVTPYPRPHGNPDPLASVWIRRLHLAPNPPPPPPHPGFAPPPPHSSFAPPPPPHEQDAVSNRSAGFGPFRWSPRPQRDAPVGAWDAAPAPAPAPPMMSPFFRSQPPPLPAVPDVGEFAPVRTAIGFGGSSGGLPGLSSRATVDVYPHSSWLATPAAGSAYPNHAVDMVPMRNSHDLHVRQHGMIPRNIPRPAPGSSSQTDEPFSYWNMGRVQRSTTTSSISQVVVAPDNFVKKRSADTNGFLPLKFRKLSRAG